MGSLLTDDTGNTLDLLITAAITSHNDKNLVDLRKSICDGSSSLKWANGKCEMKTSDINCTGSNRSISQFNLKNQTHSCDTITRSSIGAASRSHGNSQHNPQFSKNKHGNSDHSPSMEPAHNHPYAPTSHGNGNHSPDHHGSGHYN